MHRSLLLLSAGLLAMAAPTSAMYVEGYVPDTWHDLVFEVRETDDGIELVLVEGNLSEIQSGHHVNYTVRNTLGAEVIFTVESTWHGEDPVDDQGNVQKTTRLLDEVNIPADTDVTAGIAVPVDSFELRYSVAEGEREDAVQHELMNFMIMAMGGEGLEEDGNLDDDLEAQGEDADDEEEPRSSIPAVPMAIAALGLVLLVFLTRSK